MALIVKQGREYVLGGKVYKSGQAVEGVSPKFIKYLTSHKGPLQEGPDVNKTDLPKKSAEPQKSAEDIERDELRTEYQKIVGRRAFPGWTSAEIRQRMATAAEGNGEPRSGEYRRRDMRAED